MVLETIYVTRHGFRSNWVVDPVTGEYNSSIPTPTGIPSDPSLAAKGVDQSKELASRITQLDPLPEIIYSSPFYRCLQTLAPTVSALNKDRAEDDKLLIHAENGLGEFYGLARFDHPSPATITVLSDHFPHHLKKDYATPLIRPSVNGESLEGLHDRIAYCLHHVIKTLDEDPKGPKTLLICTHAASMICIGRALTGNMPKDMGEDDFRCFTCALSKFTRRETPTDSNTEIEAWNAEDPETIPDVKWQGGNGVQGGWDCETNGDCSFLSEGEERGWNWWFEPGHESLNPTYIDPADASVSIPVSPTTAVPASACAGVEAEFSLPTESAVAALEAASTLFPGPALDGQKLKNFSDKHIHKKQG